jgi:hypothetical protein
VVEFTPKIKQLKSLTRLRQLERDKSAKKLASANQELKQAKDEMLTAEARYQLILEMQRKIRQAGRAINPLYYNHQFEAADVAKFYMDKTTSEWKEIKAYKSAVLADFTQDHCQLDVARNAVHQAINEHYKLLEKNAMDDSIDQQSQKSQTQQHNGGKLI